MVIYFDAVGIKNSVIDIVFRCADVDERLPIRCLQHVILREFHIVHLVLFKEKDLVVIDPRLRLRGDGNRSLGDLKCSEVLGDLVVLVIHLATVDVKNSVIDIVFR